MTGRGVRRRLEGELDEGGAKAFSLPLLFDDASLRSRRDLDHALERVVVQLLGFLPPLTIQLVGDGGDVTVGALVEQASLEGIANRADDDPDAGHAQAVSDGVAELREEVVA